MESATINVSVLLRRLFTYGKVYIIISSYENIHTCGAMINAQTDIAKKAIIKECGKHGYVSSSISNHYVSILLYLILL
jgi:hypothetical protein